MKTFFTAASALLLSTAVYAGSPFDAEDTYGTVLFDQGAAPTGAYTEPTGPLAAELYSDDTFGSVLFDLDGRSHEHALSAPPAIGDDADDYGNVLYDLGVRY